MRPKLNPLDAQLYQAFKRALRETKDWVVPKEKLIEELEIVYFETDIGFYILKRVNDFYCQLQKEKLERNRKNLPDMKAQND